ncbi:class I SAM-dependent RNA methyltransferase [Pelagibius litoralis]|uniref:Class I SAM-dependent RNA methyltransferase n=1 Tax=Pelagibius litoralis TaxID=374515 RepID=A0A967EZ79_9PROT|nr:class I SAM-dependent RNA methyltransferase [Pelagibius litoralis]NIA70135.1 class I SAM-dependent RNA methyltransferase [Pelagibius litoralis]
MRRRARGGGGRQAEVLVDSLGAKGDGLAEVDGRPLFLPQTVPGDRVLARVTGERSGGFKGAVIELLEAGPLRAEPPCPFFGPCGGCALQHFDDAAYADWKAALLPLALERRGLEAGRLLPLVRVPPGRRRRMVLTAVRTAKAVLLGYHERESHQLVDIDNCLLATPALAALLQPLHDLLGDLLAVREEARITALESETGLDLLIDSRHVLALQDRERLAAFAEAVDLARLSWADAGSDAEPVCLRRDPILSFGGVPVVPPPGGFVQPTTEGQQVLVDRVLAAIPDTAATAADLFSGCGTFTFPLAERLEVYAAEGERDAVASLSAAARRSDRAGRVTAETRDLARFPVLADELSGGDVVVFDPPRNGAREQVRELALSDVPLVVAVSCNPTTFARDARALVDGGYRLKEATPIDQFPWSGHLELVAVFER